MKRCVYIVVVILLILGVGVQSFKCVRAESVTSTVSACAEVSTESYVEWNRTYGGTGDDIAHALVQTEDGGYALGGATSSWGAGVDDSWLVKTDALGNTLWNKTYGGTGPDWAEALVQTDDGGYATAGPTSSYGAGSNDFWLIKTDSDGNALWNRTYGGVNDDVAEALIQTGDGGYAMTGPTQSFGTGNYDFWLVRTDASGNALWNRTYGGTNQDWPQAMVQNGDGGYAIVGYTESRGAGASDAWLVRTDASGDVQWNKTYGGTSFDWAEALVQTGDGGYAAAGRTASFGAGDYDFWLVKTDGEASTIVVPDDYSTIQEAINNAADGDTIFVKAGTYYEHVVVNKTVSLVGEDVSMTIIDGSETGRVIDIVDDNVSVTGFTVQRSGSIALPDIDAGICLDGTRGCTLSGNNIVHNGGIGVHLLESSQNTVSGNNLTDNGGFAISLTVSSDNVVSSNLAVFNRLNGIGMHALSHNNVISNNSIVNSTCHGFVLNNVRNCTILGNYLANNGETGMWLQADSINNTICDNVFAGNRHGISIEWADGNIISGNTLMDGQLGIQILNAEYTEILNNTITNNYGSEWDAGIHLDSAGYTRIFCNNITDNWRAILLYNASPHVSIINNNLSCNEFGVRMRTGGSGYMNMSGNVVMNNHGYGIGLSQYSDNNTIAQNNIGLNEYGLFTEYSTQNIIYQNNFLNNTEQVYVGSGSINTWDNGYPSGGNYWSDYDGLDQYSGLHQNVTGSDGIGETPYVIDANNRDNYPLIDPFASKAYDFTVDDDGPADFSTIQEAINAANDGDRIFVKAGIYYEHVVVNKTVSLIGEDVNTTIIDGSETGNVITITSSNASIVGFTIENSGKIIPNAGIELNNVEHCMISKNNLVSNEYGIYVLNSLSSVISENNITAGHLGIEMRGSNGTSVFGNFVQSNYIGIGIVNQASMNRIFDNTVTNNGFCIYLLNCFGNTLSQNRINNKDYSSVESNFGIRIYRSSENNFSENSVAECDFGVFLEDQSDSNRFWHNDFMGNSGHVTLVGNLANVWDDGYPSGGNYWSDYSGIDAYKGFYQNETGSDGIGDAPVMFGGDNTDRYPLMTPWTESSGPVGDVNGDGKVDMKDVGYVARRFMCVPGDPLWDAAADFNSDGRINMVDIGTVARHFGESRP